MKLLFATCLAITAAACADPATGDDVVVPGACADAASICTTLHVPDDYAGTPAKVIVGLYDALPPAGPPNGIAAVIEDPLIGVGQPFPIEAHEVMPAGEFFLYVVLYDVEGGEYQPVAGVDYVVQTAAPVSVGHNALNMPDMTLSLYAE